MPTILTIVSGPPGANPTVDGDLVTFDLPGIFRVRAQCGTLSGELELPTLPGQALEHFTITMVQRGPDRGEARTMRERRLVCRALARDHGAAAMFEGLTPERPLPSVDLQLFGG